jgi:hypothetical protein
VVPVPLGGFVLSFLIFDLGNMPFLTFLDRKCLRNVFDNGNIGNGERTGISCDLDIYSLNSLVG